MRLCSRILVLAATAVGCSRPQPVQPASSLPQLTVLARPVRNGAEQIQYLAVREEIRGPIEQRSRPFSLRVGIVHTGRRGIADRVDSLVMRDVSGDVPLTIQDDPVNASGYTYYRHWRAQRAVRSPVTVSYRMRPVTRPTGGPQYEFYAHAGGMNAAGMQLFVLPETIDSALIRLNWDLSDLQAGSMVVSTYGEGNLELRGSPDTITRPFFLAGPLGKYEPPGNARFRAYWIGHPTFNAMKEMTWTYQSYDYLRRFYRDTTVKMYRVFIHAAGSGGGTGSQNSFMGSASPGNEDTTRLGPRNMLTHEMGHYFVGGLSGGAPGAGPWYGEGLNTHYTRLLLLRSGLAPVEEYLKDINDRARAYYTSAYRYLSNDSLAKIGYSTGFGGASAQNLAYSRGSLFWSELDYRIRTASEGRRTLDDLILPLFEARQKGGRLTQEVIADAIGKELGPAGRQFFESVIIRGDPLTPASGAFGPCFERRPTKFMVGPNPYDGYEWVRVASVPDTRCRQW
jgi:hypothetical protein